MIFVQSNAEEALALCRLEVRARPPRARCHFQNGAEELRQGLHEAGRKPKVRAMRFASLAVRLLEAMISEIDAIAAAGLIDRRSVIGELLAEAIEGKGAEQIPAQVWRPREVNRRRCALHPGPRTRALASHPFLDALQQLFAPDRRDPAGAVAFFAKPLTAGHAAAALTDRTQVIRCLKSCCHFADI